MMHVIGFDCTTAAIQIKGTARWLYCVNLEYLPGQQVMQLEHSESANWVVRTWQFGWLEHGREVSRPTYRTPPCAIHLAQSWRQWDLCCYSYSL